MTVRTRFAPSPTGYLHIGGARTALYCWLYARKMQGKFILRIEDTDVERSTPEAVQAILDAMAWLRLNYDEGPFYQMQRMDRYREVAEKLLAEGKVYKCYCSKERLENLRNEQMANKQKPRYDGHCRHAAPQTGSYVLRFKNPETGDVTIEDLVKGKVVIDNKELDDLIIMRSDGTPTYNFTVVVDDYDMKVTHVIRGDDHLNNTPRQINLFHALGVKPPVFAHLSMILGEDGKKLSKRHGAVSVMQYREDGFLPEAILNYLVRLGWSHGDQEIFSIDEMVEFFDINKLNNSAAAFNTSKLIWLNQHYIKTLPVDYLAQELAWHMQRIGVDINKGHALTDLILVQRDRSKTLKEMAETSQFFYQPMSAIKAELLEKHFSPEIKAALKVLVTNLQKCANWDKEHLHQVLSETCEQCGLKLGQLAQAVRIAVTGGTVSPSIDSTLALFGKEQSLQRLNQAQLS